MTPSFEHFRDIPYILPRLTLSTLLGRRLNLNHVRLSLALLGTEAFGKRRAEMLFLGPGFCLALPHKYGLPRDAFYARHEPILLLRPASGDGAPNWEKVLEPRGKARGCIRDLLVSQAPPRTIQHATARCLPTKPGSWGKLCDTSWKLEATCNHQFDAAMVRLSSPFPPIVSVPHFIHPFTPFTLLLTWLHYPILVKESHLCPRLVFSNAESLNPFVKEHC